MSTDDKVTSEEIDAELVSESSTETSPMSDTESTEETATTEEAEQANENAGPESDSDEGIMISDHALSHIDRIGSMSDKDKIQESIAKLEKSGREKDLEAARVLREKYPAPQPEQRHITDEALQDALQKKLAEMGFDPEEIKAEKEKRTINERREAIEQSLKSRGVPGNPDRIMRSPEFILAFHDDKYKSLSNTEKAELALAKVLKGKTPAQSQTGGIPQSGTPQVKKKDLSTDSWNGLSLDDLR